MMNNKHVAVFFTKYKIMHLFLIVNSFMTTALQSGTSREMNTFTFSFF